MRRLHINPFQLVLVGVLGQALSFLLETPTGALAAIVGDTILVPAGVGNSPMLTALTVGATGGNSGIL